MPQNRLAIQMRALYLDLATRCGKEILVSLRPAGCLQALRRAW